MRRLLGTATAVVACWWAAAVPALGTPTVRSAAPYPRAEAVGIRFAVVRAARASGFRDRPLTLEVTFTRRAERTLRRLRGEAVEVTCTRVEALPTNGWGEERSDGWDGLVPERGRRVVGPFLFVLEAAPDLCRLEWRRLQRPDTPVVEVALSARGARFIDERDTAGAVMDAPIETVGPERRFPLPHVVARASGGTVVALAGPSGPVPAGKTGYWSDGAFHGWVGKATKAGRVLFQEVSGDVVTSNILWFALRKVVAQSPESVDGTTYRGRSQDASA